MNDPEMMAAANEAFSKMTEDQRREMQEQVARLTPEQIAQAQSMMNGMSAEQRAHMAEMAKNATPEELLQRSRQAATMPTPTSSASESDRLKAEGNALVRDKKYEEAVGKYTLALKTPGLGLETKKAAHLNASLCFLNLNRPDEAIKHASTVIKAIDASNMKAHYRYDLCRRGIACAHSRCAHSRCAHSRCAHSRYALVRQAWAGVHEEAVQDKGGGGP